jgi:mannosyltransferase
VRALEIGRTAPTRSRTGEDERPRRDRIATLLFGFALILGLVRFWKLAEWSLWFDETATWTDLFVGIDGGEISNPLGYWLIGATVRALGGIPDEFALRFLPALAGWATIPLSWWAFRSIAGDRRASAAALLVAASSWHVYWSQNARFYTFAMAVSLAGTGILLRALPAGRIRLALIGFSVAALASLFHPSTALLLPAIAVAPWILRAARTPLSRGAERCGLALLALGVLALVIRFDWLRATWETYYRQKGTSLPQSEVHVSAERIAHLARTIGFYVTPLLGTAALAGAALGLLRRDAAALFVGLVSLLVVGEALAAALFARMTAQYVFFLLPWIAVLACWPLANLAEEEPRGGEAATTRRVLQVAYFAVLWLPALATTGLYFTVRKGERPQWREAYEFVWNRREADDLILGMEASAGEYYLAPLRTDLRLPVHVGWLDRWRPRLAEEWGRHARRAWYVVNPEQLLDWEPADAAAFEKYLREQCRLVTAFPLYVESRDLSVWVYLRD